MLAFLLFLLQLGYLFFGLVRLFWGKSFSIWSGRFVKYHSGYVDLNPFLAYVSLIVLAVFIFYCAYQIYRIYYFSEKKWLSYVYAVAPLISVAMTGFWLTLIAYVGSAGYLGLENFSNVPIFAVFLHAMFSIMSPFGVLGLVDSLSESSLFGWSLMISILATVLALSFFSKRLIAFTVAVIWSVVIVGLNFYGWMFVIIVASADSTAHDTGVSYIVTLSMLLLPWVMFVAYCVSAFWGIMRGWFWRALWPGVLSLLLSWAGFYVLLFNKASGGGVAPLLIILGLLTLFFYLWWKNLKVMRSKNRDSELTQIVDSTNMTQGRE